jgi:phosphoenolpyruvate-protein kinase (PTS system EI component)
MTEPFADKWPRESQFPIVERYHSAIRAIVAERFAASGKTWEEVVHDPAFEFTRQDFEKVEAALLATGYRFEGSAVVSLKEEPDKDKPLAATVDSGGTLTAPILADFAGVICLGGTVRAHLGILSREHQVPCLMAAQIDGLKEGDEILVEYSKRAADAYADAQTAAEQRARILKVS